MDLLAQPKKGRGKASAIKEFGAHPIHEVVVSLFNGPYGPYIKAGKVNIGLPEGMMADQLTQEKAIELVTEKMGPVASGSAKNGKAKKSKAVKKTQTTQKTNEVSKSKKLKTSKKTDKPVSDSDPIKTEPKVVIKRVAKAK